MTFPVLKFVDRPEVGATVRLDLQAGVCSVKGDGFSLGAPPFLGTPGGFGGEYGPRSVRLLVWLDGTKAACRALLSTLSRELVREGGNWLLVQLSSASPPMWLRLFRSSPQALSFEHFYSAEDTSVDQWPLSLELEAEAFAWGERVTHAPVTVNNDIAHATNPLMVRLPAIIGDGETPLVIESNALPAGKGQLAALVSVDANDPDQASYTTPLRVTTGWSLGTDTTTASTALMSGGSGYRVSFATNASLVRRLFDTTTTFAGPAGRMRSGRFRAFLRVGYTSTVASFQVRLGQLGIGTYVYGDTVTVTAPGTAGFVWVDVGEIANPFGNPVTQRYANLGMAPGDADLEIQAGRVSGGGSLDIDHLMLIPSDLTASPGAACSLAKVERGSTLGGAGTSVLYDAEEDRVVVLGASTLVHFTAIPVVPGELPYAVPGHTNILHYLRAMTSDVLTDTASLTVSYHPRWLHLPGA